MALTARPPELKETSHKQLSSIQINFSAAAVTDQDVVLPSGEFSKGIFLCGPKVPKGKALLEFLTKIALKPSRVVMLDDREENLESLEADLKSAKIPFVGHRYGAADALVKKYQKSVADMQWRHFPVLSDELAAKLLKDVN